VAVALIQAEPAPLSIDFLRTALVIIDMQRDFLEPGDGPCSMNGAGDESVLVQSQMCVGLIAIDGIRLQHARFPLILPSRVDKIFVRDS
jgi:hypothetical protein